MTRRSIHTSRAIVTGASSGIGLEIARQLAAAGTRVVAVARRADRLQDLVNQAATTRGQVYAVVGDIADPAVRQSAVDAAHSQFGGLDLLVNNAGIGAMGLFENAAPQRLRCIMEVNFFALVEMTRIALPLLKQGNRPIIVNISSILGLRGAPYNTEYSASKFAVQGFSEAIRSELARHGIDVLVVSPGTTDTEFFDKVLERTGAPSWPNHHSVPAAEVARRIIRAIQRGRHAIVPYRWARVLYWLNRLSPSLVDRLMARYA